MLDADIRVWDSQRRVFASLFQETAAFEAEDLRSYDHYIDVDFDASGRFAGHLEIYGRPVDLPARDLQTKRALQSGPFRLRLWYYQDKNDSRLDPDQWTLISKKLNNFGGVMIYRDGLRVLPYGRPVFDWLQIEERRTRGLGYYFFSYRRMFGYVSITHKNNPHLLDKAGREGLIQNSAYRDLRQCLETFFIYLARQYFKKGTAFFEQKQQLSDERKKVDEERKRAAEQRKELKEEAALKLTLIRDKVPEQLELAFRSGLERLEIMDAPNVTDLTDTLLRFEDRIAQIEGSVRFVIPRHLSIRRDRELNRLKHDHEIAFKALESESATLRVRFEQSVQDRFPDALHAASRQRALDKTYAQTLASIGKANKALRVELDARIASLTLGLDELYNRLRGEVEEILRSASHAEETGSVEGGGFAEAMAAMGTAATQAVDTLQEHQERLRVYFTRYFGETRDDLIAAQTGEIDELREQVDRDLELVQLGLAVEIIDHDLNKLFLGIRTSLARLLSLLRNTPRAMRYLEDLRSSFNHLEQRFRQMSPIYRGSYRAKNEIDGRRILAYCRDFLGHQLRTVGVSLDASVAFTSFRILEAEAVVLPVFVNVIDNAIYWLRESSDKRILLDRHGDVVTICDSGPGIHATEFEDIFEPFVSNKPSGRGLGLYIARANLKRYGHEIWATDDPVYRTLAGACICIRFHHDVINSE
jgi:signal transduction histidine kinase